MKLHSHFRRWHSPSVFTLIGLCFLLPFATVYGTSGCSSEPESSTRFTGAQLVTHTVPNGGRDPDCGHDISVCVERAGATTAAVAFGAAIVGLLLGLLGIERGPGWCASVGLGALLVLLGELASLSGDAFDVRVGLGVELALLLFVWAGLVHLRRASKRWHPVATPPLPRGHPQPDPTTFQRRP